jgi:hypothetical protein
MLKKSFMILTMMLFLSSFSALADTYAAVSGFTYYARDGAGIIGSSASSTPSGACAKAGFPYTSVNTGQYSFDGSCIMPDTTTKAVSSVAGYTCPSGGTVSGTNCINAPACDVGSVRVPSSNQQCAVKATCNFGTSWLSTNNSCTQVTCPAGQSFVASASVPAGACTATPSACLGQIMVCSATTEKYCTEENGAVKVTAACPPKTCTSAEHLNAQGDCVANLVYACPVGLHSTGNASQPCSADDITACPAGSFAGSINGERACIKTAKPMFGDNPPLVAANPNNPTPPTPTVNTAQGDTIGTATATTVNKDAAGVVTGSSSTTTTATASTKIELNTTGLAKSTDFAPLAKATDIQGLGQESTLQGIKTGVDALGGSGNTSSGYVSSPTNGYYQSKYPGGIEALWAAKKAAFTATSFVNAIHVLMPQIASSGTCPTWSTTLPFGMGTQNFNMPCDIWGFIAICFQVTALFYARTIIFGG